MTGNDGCKEEARMIDWLQIKALRDDVGAEDFEEVVEIFIEEVAEIVERLRSNPQLDTLGADLHAVKGSALNLGFTHFADLCQTGETLASEGRAEEIVLQPILGSFETRREAFLSGLAEGAAA